WTRIVIGALLCVFCLLQRVIERHAARRRTGGSGLDPKRATRETARPAAAAPGDDAALVSTMPRL
ncbi:sugar ABC transporter permease YjfF, partial [Paraburkholderia sp. SIMBA_050]